MYSMRRHKYLMWYSAIIFSIIIIIIIHYIMNVLHIDGTLSVILPENNSTVTKADSCFNITRIIITLHAVPCAWLT